ncbi:DNA replication/repair protein RecF [Jatrophihabitans cynanchi]|uniref:DNA replication and repair protein RecF n=1 Tax=Jatrophihabitans cynanchi TaxID=2944128 RepID=A0ABY7JVC8_9ACTN|nr:DNA replication/repair protein RecF [Jatrophihabitans sp. SB3-54]WAX55262.1 DNA replication/repair protein RecF [Jatrophihabitans sp. SB3-54]
MYVRHLSVADFRSWASADVAFEPGACALVGSNGQGKTNLVEALGYVATLASHRVPTDAPLVRTGCERAIVQTAIVADGRELRVELEISPGRANKARLNGAPVPRPREVLGALRWVLFAPEDLAIVRGDPSERRRFLDELVVARAPRLAGVRADYDRVLKQRAALLKSAGAARRSGSGSDLRTLDVWDGHLAEHGAQLLAARLRALQALAPHAAEAYARVAPAGAALEMQYASSLSGSLPELTAAGDPPETVVIEAALLAELARVRPNELERGVNLVGPHRDDVELRLGALPIRGYASHGEGWSAALALRLGSYELLRADFPRGAEPILVLDDVFAELDTARREHLALVAGKAEQAIITAAVASDVPEQLGGARYDVHDGTVRRVR